MNEWMNEWMNGMKYLYFPTVNYMNVLYKLTAQ